MINNHYLAWEWAIIFKIWPILQGHKYNNIFIRFLVQMKTSKFAYEINWPLNT